MKPYQIIRFSLMICLTLCPLFLFLMWLQYPFSHPEKQIAPPYAPMDLRPILRQDTLSLEDYTVLFHQTGLGAVHIDRIRRESKDGISEISMIQEIFFQEQQLLCMPIFWHFVREDRMIDSDGMFRQGVPLLGLEAGDILLSFSAHSFGWRHGHAAIVVATEGEVKILEARQLGTRSQLNTAQSWTMYSNYAVLRLKDATQEERKSIADYAYTNLLDVPYHLTSGFAKEKAPSHQDEDFGVQCSYLVWYAYQAFGYDLDSDGGALVSTKDLFESPLLEVIQFYGMPLQDA